MRLERQAGWAAMQRHLLRGGVVLSSPTLRSHCPVLQVKKLRLSGAKLLAQSDRARWGTEGFHRLHAASQGDAPAGGGPLSIGSYP